MKRTPSGVCVDSSCCSGDGLLVLVEARMSLWEGMMERTKSLMQKGSCLMFEGMTRQKRMSGLSRTEVDDQKVGRAVKRDSNERLVESKEGPRRYEHMGIGGGSPSRSMTCMSGRESCVERMICFCVSAKMSNP